MTVSTLGIFGFMASIKVTLICSLSSDDNPVQMLPEVQTLLRLHHRAPEREEQTLTALFLAHEDVLLLNLEPIKPEENIRSQRCYRWLLCRAKCVCYSSLIIILLRLLSSNSFILRGIFPCLYLNATAVNT